MSEQNRNLLVSFERAPTMTAYFEQIDAIPANPVLQELKHFSSNYERHLKSQTEPDFMNSGENQAFNHAKAQAASSPMSSPAHASNSLCARVDSAVATVRDLEGQLRSAKPEDKPAIASRLKEADKALAAAKVALEEARYRVIAEAEQKSQPSQGQSLIPHVMSQIHSKGNG